MRVCLISLLLVAVGLLAGCTTPTNGVSHSETELRRELEETRAQVDQLRAETARLRQEVRALELSNGPLRPVAPQYPPPKEPPWNNPQTNPAPPLTPLSQNWQDSDRPELKNAEEFYHKGQLDLAEQELTDVLKTDPGNKEARYYLLLVVEDRYQREMTSQQPTPYG